MILPKASTHLNPAMHSVHVPVTTMSSQLRPQHNSVAAYRNDLRQFHYLHLAVIYNSVKFEMCVQSVAPSSFFSVAGNSVNTHVKLAYFRIFHVKNY